MKGDEAERSDKTKQRRAALLERILARQNEKKSKFDAKNEEQLMAKHRKTKWTLIEKLKFLSKNC